MRYYDGHYIQLCKQFGIDLAFSGISIGEIYLNCADTINFRFAVSNGSISSFNIMRKLFLKISSFLNSSNKSSSAKLLVNNSNIKFSDGYRDTSNARYAVNEHGCLEEISNDKLSNQSK